MPNLRGKTWTTTTPAYVEDAQYWEDHLISDADAAKITTSVQSVNNTTPDAQGNVNIVALPSGGTAGQVLTKQSSTEGDADWENPASSGHTIIDENGDDMPYRTNLQFTNAEVTDDSANDTTIVDCKGEKGDPGQAATITIGTTTTLPAGSSATVTNSGTSSAAVFNFGIPKGADGTGAGDMLKADYDPNSVVELAGGIPDYVASQAYTLPTAASNVLGGVKVGTNLSIDASGVLSATDTNTDALHDLTDVNISLPSNGQALLYDSTNNKWVNGDVAGSASDITYDNTDSGLTATDVQDAVDEVNADKADKTQITNPNLLDNPWFTVNQRGQSSYDNSAGTSSIYFVDRWKISQGLSVTINADNSVTITNNTSSNTWFSQILYMPEYDLVGGESITMSLKMSDNTIFEFSTKVPTTVTTVNKAIGDKGIASFRNQRLSGDGYHFVIFISANSSATIKACKLELGSISTLAMDTAPNYATELLKCQRYFVRVTGGTNNNGILSVGGFVLSASQVRCQVPLPIQMRTNPGITTGGNIRIGTPSSTIVTSDKITSWAIASLSPNHINISANVDATLTVGTSVNYYCQSDTTAHIDLLADL